MNFSNLSFKAKRKPIYITTYTSKKYKCLNNEFLEKETSIITMQDIWLIDIGKANTTTKAWIKKVAKNVLEKNEKIKEKKKSK